MTFHRWEFLLKDETTIVARFTDEEIEDMKIKYPKVRWIPR